MDSNEIWCVSVDHGSTVSCQIWSASEKGNGHKSPTKYENLVEIAIFQRFLPHMGDTVH